MPDNFTSPADTRRVPRSQVIAAIHSFADYLAEHPELPAPHTFTAHATLTDVRDGETANEAATRWVHMHGLDQGAIFDGEYTAMVTVPVASSDLHGIRIDYDGHFHKAPAERAP